MTNTVHSPAASSAPVAEDARRSACDCCRRPIPGLQFLLDDGRVVCALCVSTPATVGLRVAAPLVDHVVAYGSSDAVASMLHPDQRHPGIRTGIAPAPVAAVCGSDQAERGLTTGERRSPSPTTCGGGHA